MAAKEFRGKCMRPLRERVQTVRPLRVGFTLRAEAVPRVCRPMLLRKKKSFHTKGVTTATGKGVAYENAYTR